MDGLKAVINRIILTAPKTFLMTLAFVFVLVHLAGCKHLELTSHWPDSDVKVDGVNSEWENSTTFIEDEKVLVGVMNDSDFLYLSLITDNPALRRQMMGRGFTVWFDPAGGKKKAFGIQYPLGFQEMGVSMADFVGPDADIDKRREIMEQSLTELIIRGSDKDDWDRMATKDATGIEVRISDSGPFIYELKVPLRKSEDHPYAIGATRESMGIGLEMQKFDREGMMAGRGGRMRGGHIGPPGGMRGGMGRPPDGGMRRPEMAEPIKLWAKVRLAQRTD
jgi:hypothetical protein